MTIILYKLAQFFLVLFLGYGLARGGIIEERDLALLSRLVTRVLLPVFTFCSLYQGNTRQQLAQSLPVLPFTLLFYLALGALLALLAGVLGLQGERKRAFQALFLFGNTGFIGFPIIQSLNGGSGVIPMSMFSLVDQAILWSYGVWLCGSGGKFRLRSLLNPCMTAILLAMTVILTGLPVPPLLAETAAMVGNANTAVCMLYLGALLYFSRLRAVLKEKELYIGIAVKMLLVPACVGLVLGGLMPDTVMRQTLVILSALPTMTVIPILVKSGSGEGEYAAGVTMVTLLASLVTLPLVACLVL